MKKKAFLDLGFLRSTSSSKPPPELEEPRHNTRLTIKTGEDHRAEHLPAPLPVAPPTGLSFSDNIDRSYYQEHSPLFKLPFELREKIYLDTLGHNCIHVTCTRKRLAHIRCPYRAVVKRMSTLGHDCWGYTAEEGLIFLRAASGKHSKHGSLMGIVRSCRRAYVPPCRILSPRSFVTKDIDMRNRSNFSTLTTISTSSTPESSSSSKHTPRRNLSVA